MSVVHYQIELYDVSMIRALARQLARAAESHPTSAEDPWEHERRARARLAAAALALDEIGDRAILVPDDKVVRNRGRLAGVKQRPRLSQIQVSWHPPPGLFKADAPTIARHVAAESDSLAQAISRVSFYENRAGRNLSAATKKKLAEVKRLLHARWRR